MMRFQLRIQMNQQSLSQVSQREPCSGSERPCPKAPVYLNTYHFSSCFNCFCNCLGIGVYHTGVQVFNYEYMYFGFDGDETGVGYLEPKTAAYQFKEQKLLGYTQYKLAEIEDHVLQPLMRGHYVGNRYDLLSFNCNHFSRRFAQMLQVEEVPAEVFCLTDFFNRCRCCIPNCILNGRLDWFSSGDKDDYESIQESQHVSFRHDTDHR